MRPGRKRVRWMNKVLQAIRQAVCACKGHTYDFRNVDEMHFEEKETTVFVVRCTRCRCYTGFAVKDSALRVTYPLELNIKRSVLDV